MKSTITKENIIRELSESTSLPLRDCRIIYDNLIDIIKTHLLNGDNVFLYNFLKIEIYKRKAMKIPDSRNKKKLKKISPSKALRVRLSRTFKKKFRDFYS